MYTVIIISPHLQTHTHTHARVDLRPHRFGYMIDNVILLLIGTRNKREMSELLPKCHPLGMFDEIGVVTVATTPGELYSCVLKDTPLGPFMAKCLKAPDLDELNIEIIRNTLFKE